MQRKKKDERKKITFRKIGGGSFRTADGRIIKPNQTFKAYPDDIPDGFKDVVKALEPLPEESPIETVSNFELEEAEQPSEKATPEGDEWEIEPREDEEDAWNVVSTTSRKPMNERPLSRDEAEEFLKTLQE
jgi:hypothetical protein